VSVLEWTIVFELGILLVMAAMWLIARKPDEDQPGEPAYRTALAFWRVILDRKSPFAVMHIDPDRPMFGLYSFTPQGPAYTPPDPQKVAVIPVIVVADSSCDQIVGFQDDAIKMLVSAAAGAGQSNKAVIQLLIEVLALQPYQIQLIRGHYNTRKIVQITGMDRAAVDKKLASFL
jgi:uncharacterized protein YggU (UPF0235/DUF167 family)